jgi:hypothetical protein
VAERTTLVKIKEGGGTLFLLDGRRLGVRPQDLHKCSQWTIMSELEISEKSSDLIYPLKVYNIDQKEEVFAVWF